MFAASWTPEQWSAIIVVVGLQLGQLIKAWRGDRTTKATAETLAVKVANSADKVTDSHQGLAAKVDNVLDVVAHNAARLDASIRIRQELSDRVDGQGHQLKDHDRRIAVIERHPALRSGQ